MNTPRSLRDVIRAHRVAIVEAFVAEVECKGLSPRSLPKEAILDHLEELVEDISAALETLPVPTILPTARKHAADRWERGFDLPWLVREYDLLRQMILRVASGYGLSISTPDSDALATAINLAMAVAVEEYVRCRDEEAMRHRRELDEAHAVLESLLMAAPLGIAFFDRDMRFRIINPRLAEIHGIPPADHIGRTVMDVVPLAPRALIAEAQSDVLRSGQTRTVEIATETAATPGRTRTFIVHWYPVKSSAGNIGVGVLVEDITERRAAETFRENILGVVSHDLRSPVQATSMSVELMLRRVGLPDDARRLAGAIRRSASRMTAIIDQLFDYVRLDRDGTVPLIRRKIELADVARRIIEETGLAFQGRNVDVRLSVEGDTSGWWDEGRVAQVLANLVRNAIQHGDGHAELRLRGDADLVSIVVENTGRPIPPAALARIFEPFQSGSRAAGHLGLGLYITRHVVLAHGGSIVVRSDEQGTAVTVALPRSGER